MSVSPTSSHHPAPSGLFGWFTERVMPGSAAWRFPLLATAIVAAGLAGADWPGPREFGLRLALAFLLVVSLRLVDDLVDLRSDRETHPERVLVRARSIAPYVVCAIAGLAASFFVLLAHSPSRAPGLIALLAGLGCWYSLGQRAPWIHALVLLSKYPALVLLLGSEGMGHPARIASAALLYTALLFYERATDPELQ